MKVEPTGIVFVGQCEVQGPTCAARGGGSLTAVWEMPGRRQVNVCRACLDEMVRSGEWAIEGARIQSHADLAVLGRHGRPVLVVEVKRSPPFAVDAEAWAKRVRRNLLAHRGLPHAKHFLLTVFPGRSYLWSTASGELDAPPTSSFDVSDQIKEYLQEDEVASSENLERAVASWLRSIIEHHRPSPESFKKFGLLEEIGGGQVVSHYPQ